MFSFVLVFDPTLCHQLLEMVDFSLLFPCTEHQGLTYLRTNGMLHMACDNTTLVRKAQHTYTIKNYVVVILLGMVLDMPTGYASPLPRKTHQIYMFIPLNLGSLVRFFRMDIV